MKDPVEVCLLSHGIMSPVAQSLSAPLQIGVRFLHNPLPAAPTAFLTVCLLLKKKAVIRAYRVPPE
ncbi:TPA: hypothetical protein G8N79_002184 [Salmonella enterica]|nr:hypothetical protein [Salmonella enterica]